MFEKGPIILSVIGCLFASAVKSETDNRKKDRTERPIIRDFTQVKEPHRFSGDIRNNGEYGGRMGRLPANVEIQHYVFDEIGVQQRADAAPSRSATTVIYSNSNSLEMPGSCHGSVVWAPTAGGRVGDDLGTVATDPCELAEVQVDVHGGNLDPAAVPEQFNVTLQLWKSCPDDPAYTPNALTSPITFIDLNDNEVSVLTMPIPAETIPPSTTIWVTGIFPDNGIPGDPLHVGAGFIVGSPPEKGLSVDGLLGDDIGCYNRIGTGWPDFPHGSIAAKVLAQGACEIGFRAYQAVNNSQTEFDRGRNIRIADDITLSVDECELRSYEIGVIGSNRAFQLTADLRTGRFDGLFPQPLNTIPGTEGVFLGQGLGNTEIAKFTFPPGIAVPKVVWVTWSANQRNTGAILTQEAQIGSSSDLYAFEDPNIKRCSLNLDPCVDDPDCPTGQICSGWIGETFPGATTGIFYVAVNCRGEVPTGACCCVAEEGDALDGHCVDNVPSANCSPGRWAPDATCADVPSPFDPPCGFAACCIENNLGGSTCRNLLESECDGASECSGPQCLNKPGVWQPGQFCGKNGQSCFEFPCYYADDINASCAITHPVATACADDADCRPEDGWHWGCNHITSQCAYPVGCDNIQCCDTVCGDPSFKQCCDPRVGWEFHCTQQAQNNCLLVPANDECYDPANPDDHATAIHMTPDGEGGLHAFVAASDLWRAGWNEGADPGLCCNNSGVNLPAMSSEWFVVESQGTSTRISSCDSDEQIGQDTIIQVFAPANPGDLASECADLMPLACSEDSGCGIDGSLSDMCASGIPAGNPIYIMLASATSLAKPGYVLTIQQPCPTSSVEPDYTNCSGARIVPTGVEKVLFGCNGNSDGVCLEGTSLSCEGLSETEQCFDALKNDVWIDYSPDCTGLLNIESCEPPPLTSPDTILAIYGNPNGGGPLCPDEGGILLDCNDDARVNAQEHEVRAQSCSLGRATCASNTDCELLIEECVEGRCSTLCGNEESCPLPGQKCVGGECLRPCDSDQDCTLMACSIGRNLCTDDNDCNVGLCSWDRQTVCDASVTFEPCPDVCRSAPQFVCDRFAQPGQPGSCSPGDLCIEQDCIRNETCLGEKCESDCWPGSVVRVPVSMGSIYKVRLGGEYGSEPEGSLKFECQPQDCLANGVPDICEISCDGMNGACNLWAGQGCGTAQDCNDNAVPDECDIIVDPTLDVLPPGGNGVPDSCETYCPEGPIVFAAPTSPMSDAGQPHPIDSSEVTQGYSVFLTAGPRGATDLTCWTLTETDAGKCGNRINSVLETAPGEYKITLDHPLQAASITTITYDWGSGSSFGVFTALPGDVDSSGQTGVADVGALVDCLDAGSCDTWRCDIDRLGGCTGADLERLIDLLNDAGAYSGWEGASAADVACPPTVPRDN